MSYKGQVTVIPMGVQGLVTDVPQNIQDPTSLIIANNIELLNNVVQKSPGSKRFNDVAFANPVVGLYDFWPDPVTQRLIVVTDDGTIYKMPEMETQTTITPDGTSEPTTLNVSKQVLMVAGGQESSARTRKLFVMTGNNVVQVISGDGNTRTNISTPPTDWSGTNQPFFGIIHRNRLWAFGNENDRHRVYASTTTDHEDFTSTGSLQFPVDSGEGEKLISAFVYKGRLFLIKFPFGVYFLDDSDNDTANWAIKKLTTEIGGASPNSVTGALDDVLLGNSNGSISSLVAADTFGDVRSADVMNILGSEQFLREETNPSGEDSRYGIYYPEKRQVFFTYKTKSGQSNNRILNIDFSSQKGRVGWYDKDQANCLALRKDVNLVSRPIYGANDGYVYIMDSQDRNVGGSAYTGEFQTPHMDFGFGNRIIAEQNKNFEFLEITFEPTGDWDLDVDVFIDRELSQSLKFNLKGRSVLDQFKLDEDRLHAGVPISLRKRIGGQGRRISFKCSNGNVDENFRIIQLSVYYKLSDQRQRAG